MPEKHVAVGVVVVDWADEGERLPDVSNTMTGGSVTVAPIVCKPHEASPL